MIIFSDLYSLLWSSFFHIFFEILINKIRYKNSDWKLLKSSRYNIFKFFSFCHALIYLAESLKIFIRYLIMFSKIKISSSSSLDSRKRYRCSNALSLTQFLIYAILICFFLTKLFFTNQFWFWTNLSCNYTLYILKIKLILLVRMSELENLVNHLKLVLLSALDAIIDYSYYKCWTEDVSCYIVSWQLLLKLMILSVIRSLVWIECSSFFINVNSFLVSYCADLLILFCISRRLTILQSMFICYFIIFHFLI